jgi:hypothetical protein
LALLLDQIRQRRPEPVGSDCWQLMPFPGFTSPGLDTPSRNPRPRRSHTPPRAGRNRTIPRS